MILSASDQVIVFLWTIVCGMIVALIYDIFRIFRRAVKTGSLVTFVQDILYWIITSVVMFLTIYHSNDGELRGFLFIGALIGVILYALLFSRVIIGSSLFIINTTVRIIKFIVFIVSYPLRMIVRLIVLPVYKLVKSALKALQKAMGKERAKRGEQEKRGDQERQAKSI